MDIFSYENARQIGDQNILRKVDTLMDWPAISVLLKNGLKRSGLGPHNQNRTLTARAIADMKTFGHRS